MTVTPRIFVGSSFPEAVEAVLARGLAPYSVIRPPKRGASNLVADGSPDPVDADVVFGQPTIEAIVASPRVRWVQLTSAGYTRYAEPEVQALFAAREIILTTSSSVYAEPCATHALTLILALLRRLDEAMDDQRGERRWPADALRAGSAVLSEKRVLVLGHGAIGARLCALLAPFGAEVRAMRSRPRGDEAVRVVTPAAIDAELEAADVVVSTLPESPSTRGFLDRAHVDRMKPGAIFVNVGRGTTVDQVALTEALAAGRLGGAGLDVTEPEPLPSNHPLWSMPRCIITPHAAGGRADEHLRLVEHFLRNLDRFVRGEALADQVAMKP